MMKLNRLSQISMVTMILLELVLLSLLGTALISFVNTTTKMDAFKLKSTARDIALLMSAMHSLVDDVNVTYVTPFDNKYYLVSADDVVVKVYKASDKSLEKIFPYIHYKDSKTDFPALRLISMNISKSYKNFHAKGEK